MTHRFFVPGRIEVLGKHTDYAGGRALLAAVDRGFTVSVRSAPDDRVLVTDTGRRQTIGVPLEPDRAVPKNRPHWRVYPRTVVRRVQRDFPDSVDGCVVELSSNLPSSAGLSSSSALVTAVFLALDAVSGISATDRYRAAIPDRIALAAYLGALESGGPFPPLDDQPSTRVAGVGTRGGSEDHLAILCARPGALIHASFAPVEIHETVSLPAGHRFVIAASGVRAVKSGAARERYNRLSDDAARVAALWRAATGRDEPHLGAILASAAGRRVWDALWSLAARDERDRLRRRVRHFIAESREIVPAAAAALAEGRLDRFGDLVDRSQALAEILLGNQVPETARLARSARELGAVAASAFGAGFGGAVWALVPDGDASEFRDRWRADYGRAFPNRTSAFFDTAASAGARGL